MAVYKCTICDTLFDEAKEIKGWNELEDDWACGVCASGKSLWQPMADGSRSEDSAAVAEADSETGIRSR